jgi:hypothetical protein
LGLAVGEVFGGVAVELACVAAPEVEALADRREKR